MVKAKPQRRQGRGLRPHATLRNGLRVRMFEGPHLGGGVVSATPDEVLAALDRLDPDLPWKKVRDQVVPVLPRVRPFPGPDLDLVRTVLPPGILVSFAIDIGPALTHIGSDLLESWPIDRATLVATGLANLRRLADDCGPERVLHDHIGDVPIGVFQSRVGIASATLLIPDRLARIWLGAARYPQNVNIAAATALAGLGLDRTRLVIVADPAITDHVVEIEAAGAFGRFVFREEVRPTEDNPKTGKLVAMAVIKTLRQLASPVVIGA